MHHYEVRLLTAERHPSLILVEPSSVIQAFRTVRTFGRSGHFVQVWRDHECVHDEELVP